MTMQENSNLVQIFQAMGLTDSLAAFILGVEGTISPQEAAERIMKEIEEKRQK